MNDRIYIPASDNTISEIIKLAKIEKRSMASMASILLDLGLKLRKEDIKIENNETPPNER